MSIVSTQVAPRLHHLHKKEGQFDTHISSITGGYLIFHLILILKRLRERDLNPQPWAYESPGLPKSCYILTYGCFHEF